MNEVLKAIQERRSIRKFKPDMVPCQLVDEIITAGLYAASGMGRQNTKIIAITDKSIRDKFSDMNRAIGGWKEGFAPFYGAPVVLLIIADKSEGKELYDGSLVMGNLMLAAHALGIGSCWIHRAKEEVESELGQELLQKLGIEGSWEGIGHCVLGYPDGEIPKAAPRKDNRVYYVE